MTRSCHSHPQKLTKLLRIIMTCEIVRDIKILINTPQYCQIFHSIAQYCPAVFHIVQYCPILLSTIQYCSLLLDIFQMAILALSDLSYYIVMSYSFDHYLILSSISWHSSVFTKIWQCWPFVPIFRITTQPFQFGSHFNKSKSVL